MITNKLKKALLLPLLFLFISNTLIAQNKYLKIEDPFTNASVYPEYIDNITWSGNSSFTFISNDSLLKANIKNNKKEVVVTLDVLNSKISKLNKEELKYFPSVEWNSENTFYFTVNKTVFLYNIKEKNLKLISEIEENANNLEYHKKTLKVAYTIGNNLFFSDNNIKKQITDDGKWGIVNGKSVHRQEFGIEKGIFWSPNANFIAFYRMDETMVTDYPLVKISSTPAELFNNKYPMAGQKSHHVTVGVYNINTGKTIFLNTGEPAEQYLTNISWSPDEKYIYIAVLNRGQNHYKLNKYDVTNGNLNSTLFEEKNKKYVEPQHPLFFLNNNNDNFIWLSRKDGYTHAYLYNSKGNLQGQITKGKWEVDEIFGFDVENNNMYFAANKDNPIGKDIYSVNLKSKLITRITIIIGTHTAVFSPDFKYLIDQFSNSKDVVNRYDLVSNNGNIIRTLLNSKNPLETYDMGETTIFTIKSEDGSDLYCRLIKPANMAAGKKYPVFYYVYGGPHSQLVTDEWLGGAGLFQNYMAQQGYVVFTMDNRGTARRGADFEQAIFRNLGVNEMADQLLGVEYLKKQDYVDVKRIGVHGWSYGGFMTITMMLKNPGLFKAAIAGGPVTDWKYYEVMYGERYMDTPEENPEGYKNSSLMNYAKDLEGRLLVVHGAMDSTVVWQNSLSLVQKFIDEGKLVDYFVYPNQPHNNRGRAALHLYRKIEQYFNDHL